MLGLSIDIILDLWSITALHVHVDEYSIVAIKIGTHYTARSMVNHKLSGSKLHSSVVNYMHCATEANVHAWLEFLMIMPIL